MSLEAKGCLALYPMQNVLHIANLFCRIKGMRNQENNLKQICFYVPIK